MKKAESTIKIWSMDWSKSIEVPQDCAQLIKKFKSQIRKVIGGEFQWELSWGVPTHFIDNKNGLIEQN